MFALVYQNQTDAGKAKALVNFLTWALTTGQNFPATINYAPMGKILQQRSLGQVNKIKLNGKPLVKIPISFDVVSAASHRAGAREAQALHQQRLRFADTSFRVLVAGTAALILLAFVATAFFLVKEAWPALSHYGT